MKLFKNYKKLYETEVANRKLYEQRYKDIYSENINYQKEIKKLKYNLTKARIDLEDTQGFLKQEKALSYALRQERKKLQNKIKQLKENNKELKVKKIKEASPTVITMPKVEMPQVTIMPLKTEPLIRKEDE